MKRIHQGCLAVMVKIYQEARSECLHDILIRGHMTITVFQLDCWCHTLFITSIVTTLKNAVLWSTVHVCTQIVLLESL